MKVSVIPQPTNVVIEYEGKVIFCDTESALIAFIMNAKRIAERAYKDTHDRNFNREKMDFDFYSKFGEVYRDTVFENMDFANPMEL